MPVGTQGSVKSLTQLMLEEAGAEIILANTYHLYLRPGHQVVNELGGLHSFIAWNRPILTDSGGFQVFSLGELRKLSEQGAEFQSHLDGSRHFVSPEKSMEIQALLGSDIVMAFDECTPFPATRDEALKSLELTSRWARRSKDRLSAIHEGSSTDAPPDGRPVNSSQALFGINQGSVYTDLRGQSLEQLIRIGFDGYAIGGLSVGEDKNSMFDVVSHIAPRMPIEQPRYLMGVGTPEDIVRAVQLGVDMFDCVLPTRNARNGQLFTSTGRVNITNARHKVDGRAIDERCRCPVCARYSRAYLRHLYMSGEILSAVLNSLHNICFYLDTMSRIRQSIELGTFNEFCNSFLEDLARGQD
jgi:queuine tRNA-ribosyltransferase